MKTALLTSLALGIALSHASAQTPEFIPGQTVVGLIDAVIWPELAASFEAVKGTKLKITAGSSVPGSKVRVAIANEAGQVLDKWTLKGGDTFKKKFVAPKTGSYELRLEWLGGAMTEVRCVTKAKLSKKAKAKTKTLSPGVAGGLIETTVNAVAGSMLAVGVVAVNHGLEELQNVEAEVVRPDGTEVPLFVNYESDGLSLFDVPLDQTGKYRVRYHSLPTPNSTFQLTTKPAPPMPAFPELYLN